MAAASGHSTAAPQMTVHGKQGGGVVAVAASFEAAGIHHLEAAKVSVTTLEAHEAQ